MTQEPEGSIAVVLVDDSAEFMRAACAWLERQAGLRLAGTARDGIKAQEVVARLAPDVVLMDAFMPHQGGLAATRAIKSRPGAPVVILLSVHDGRDMEQEAQAAGADAFLTKSQFAARLPELLREFFEARYPALAARGDGRLGGRED